MIDILIAEDSRIQAKMLEKRLLAEGYAVRWAADGAEALRMAREQRPTLIISDIEMPMMTGYEFCEAIKQDADLRSIPFILLSTLSDPGDIIRGIHVGADNYVTKPYDGDYLVLRVQSLLDTTIEEESPDDEDGLEVTLAGQKYTVHAGRRRVLNLLISTFENAVEKNNELIRINEDLSIAQGNLKAQNTELTQLNAQLGTANDRMSRDLSAAARIQQSLLPSDTPCVDNMKFAWRYTPCDELAGDFLNFFCLDDEHVALFVADVSGHGVPSSLLSVAIGRMMTPQASMSSLLVKPTPDDTVLVEGPIAVAEELNRRFQMADQGGLYFTIVYCILNHRTGILRYFSAGHTPVVRQPIGSAPMILEAEGFPVGIVEDIDMCEVTVQLSPGDRIYLYSDGVPEAMDKDMNQFGNDRMLACFTGGASKTLDDNVQGLLSTVQDWCRVNGPLDDVSILGVEWLG